MNKNGETGQVFCWIVLECAGFQTAPSLLTGYAISKELLIGVILIAYRLANLRRGFL